MMSKAGDDMLSRKKRSGAGFTLVELLMVIAIIGILSGLTFVAVGAAKKRAHIAKAQAEVRELVKAWNVYWMTFNKWPDSLNGRQNAEMTKASMDFLTGGNDLKLVLLDVEVTAQGFLDPWGKPYVVDFSQTRTPGRDIYEACVALPMQRRYEYEDM